MNETTREFFTNPETYENVSRPIPEPEEGKAYALRALEAKDVFLVSKIISDIGIKEFKECFNSDTLKEVAGDSGNSDAVMSVGIAVFMDIAEIVFRNLPKCEKDVYSFLSSLSGMTESEIESLPMVTFTEMIIDVVQKEEFKDFMQVVSGLFK